MRDLEKNYLQFVRDESEFLCIKKDFYKVIIKTSNEYVKKRNYCGECVYNLNSRIKEEYDLSDIKFIYYKKKHCLSTMIGTDNNTLVTVGCDNCPSDIKEYSYISNCNECVNLIKDDEFFKKVINATHNLDHKYSYEFFIKNYDMLEDVFPILNISPSGNRYSIFHQQISIWSEVSYLKKKKKITT